MNKSARDQILSRLRKTSLGINQPGERLAPILKSDPDSDNRIEQFKINQEAVNSEVLITTKEKWIGDLAGIIEKYQIRTLLYGPGAEPGSILKQAVDSGKVKLPALIPYELSIEAFKQRLFELDAAITTSFGGISETGALILCPDEHEPRLMSLVPPIHIALVKVETIFSSFTEAVMKAGWSTRIPTNVVLISGPSKTADIELILAHGVHGPKKLIILVIR